MSDRKPLPQRREIKEIKEALGIKYTEALRIYESADIRKIKEDLDVSYVEAFKIFADEQKSDG